ncbi:MAG: trypsin-like peptidase domain-containing protein [Cyanobacteria bacterium SZAS TMP-1]|nr:trypsin-like peptidase domain-containing protein [Cyanobacteria bacterium SZAS TMP-1]
MASDKGCVTIHAIDNNNTMDAILGHGLAIQTKLECGQSLSRQAMEEMGPKSVQVLTTTADGRGKGSGFFVGKDGDLVVTNAHVVADNQKVQVTTPSGEKFSTQIIDIDDINDLAVLQVEGIKKDPSRSVTLGDESKLKNGDPMLAIGHPGGFEQPVVSDGSFIEEKPWIMHYQIDSTDWLIKSLAHFNVDHPAYAKDATDNMFAPKLGMDTALWHGSSGGAVVDEHNRVVGISDAIDEQNPYLSLAVPVSKLKDLLNRKEPKYGFVYEGQSEFDRAPSATILKDSAVAIAAVAARKYVAPLFATVYAMDAAENLATASGDTYRSRWHYLERGAEDLAGVAGGVMSVIPRTRTIGLGLVGAKLLINTCRDFMPDTSVLKEIHRTNGDPRVPLLWDGKVF